jgi:TonB-linked SusC/RagA family outer membrane protein
MFFSMTTAWSQQTITGTVTGQENSEPLIGVSVMVQGKSTGTVSDFNGTYSVKAAPTDSLIFSYVGFDPQTIAVGSQTTIDIALSPDYNQLDEVVVIGYGTQQKRDVSGAVSSIDGDDISSQAVTTLDQGLQGQAAGVLVTQASGEPGGGVSIRIRGVGSLGNNEPLYVIDGYPTTASGLSALNPNNIASIDILKDASATAIYGARAANGVVIITTKRGEEGQTSVTFDTYFGVQTRPEFFEVLDAQQFANLAVEIGDKEQEVVLDEWRSPGNLQTINWQDVMLRQALQQSYNATVRGGNERTRASLSVGYFDQEGIVEGSFFERINARTNVDHQIGDRLSVGTSVLFSNVQQASLFGSGQNGAGSLSQLPQLIPALTAGGTNGQVQDAEGNYGYWPFSDAIPNSFDNPLAAINTREQNNFTNRLLGTIFAELELLKGLTYKINLGTDIRASNGNGFTEAFNRGRVVNVDADYYQYENTFTEWLIENTLTYNRSFGLTDLNVVAGISAQETKFDFLSANSEGFVSNEFRSISDGIAREASGSQTRGSLASYFGRLNYKMLDRYILSATVRRDGSSNFGNNNKWGVFPSFSAAWIVSDEFFLKDVAALDNLKLRGSWGQTGVQDIPAFAYLSVLSSSNNSYIYGTNPSEVAGIAFNGLPNPDLRWETTTQLNIGIDAAFFEGKINLTVDYYDRESEDILLNIPLPSTSGFNSAFRNAGTIRNNGIELALGYRNYDNAFKWGVSANFTTVNNEVLSLGGGEPISNTSALGIPSFGQFSSFTRTEEGGEIGAFYGWVTDGIFQSQAEIEAHAEQSTETQPGDRRFVDISGPDGMPDGVINDLDRTFLGSPIPDFYGGLNFDAQYKGFDFSLLFTGTYGNEILNYQKSNLLNINFDNSVGFSNISQETFDNYWQGAGTSDDIPRLTVDDPNQNSRVSDFFVEDASFLRLKNLQLGYTLPAGLLPVGSIRLYVSGQNLLTFTEYSGYDPEIGSLNNQVTTTGIDVGNFPLAQTYLFGLNVTF